jgi:hypothetical protein
MQHSKDYYLRGHPRSCWCTHISKIPLPGLCGICKLRFRGLRRLHKLRKTTILELFALVIENPNYGALIGFVYIIPINRCHSTHIAPHQFSITTLHNMAPNFSDFRQMFFGQMFGKQILPEVDLTGKTIVITGGNSGLGFEAAKHL